MRGTMSVSQEGRYIHLNPCRGNQPLASNPESWPHSSFQTASCQRGGNPQGDGFPPRRGCLAIPCVSQFGSWSRHGGMTVPSLDWRNAGGAWAIIWPDRHGQCVQRCSSSGETSQRIRQLQLARDSATHRRITRAQHRTQGLTLAKPVSLVNAARHRGLRATGTRPSLLGTRAIPCSSGSRNGERSRSGRTGSRKGCTE